MFERNEDLSGKGVVLLLSHLLTASTPHLGCWWWDHFVICWISYQFIWLFSTLHFKVEVPPARSSHSCLLPCWQTVKQVQLERLSNQAFLPSPQPPSPCPTVHAWICRFFHSLFFGTIFHQNVQFSSCQVLTDILRDFQIKHSSKLPLTLLLLLLFHKVRQKNKQWNCSQAKK